MFCPVNSSPHTPGGQSFSVFPAPRAVTPCLTQALSASIASAPRCLYTLSYWGRFTLMKLSRGTSHVTLSQLASVFLSPPCLANQPCISKNRLQAEALQQPGGPHWGLALAVRGTVLPPGSRLWRFSQPAWGQGSATPPAGRS